MLQNPSLPTVLCLLKPPRLGDRPQSLTSSQNPEHSPGFCSAGVRRAPVLGQAGQEEPPTAWSACLAPIHQCVSGLALSRPPAATVLKGPEILAASSRQPRAHYHPGELQGSLCLPLPCFAALL